MTQPGSLPPLQRLVEVWHTACEDLLALARHLDPDDWDRPTDLEGWDVHANLAHCAHLEAVVAGAPEDTVEVAPAPHLRSPMAFYTEQGVLARRDRSPAELLDELADAVARRYAELRADPPTEADAPAPRTPGGIGWSTGTLLSNRPLDIWMHEQDVRRATGRPGGWESPAASHVLHVFGRALPLVWGKRAAAPVDAVLHLELVDRDLGWTVRVGDDGRAVRDESATPSTRVRMTSEDYVVLSGGRRPVSSTAAEVDGDTDADAELGRRVLDSLAVTP